ncbi:hypothetical protein KSS87_001910 [Heliosperma pusillum]|nr:hypothetical protein KSS87_001910 [Heliosperma pusillum]
MKVLHFVTLHVLFGLLLCSFASSDFGVLESVPDVSEVEEIDYDRLDEVQKSCSSVVDSGLEFTLNLDHNEINVLKNELSFSNGDWEQVGTSAPIMPFVNFFWLNSSDGGYSRIHRRFGSKIPFELVSFELTDISLDHKSKKTMAVNGKLSMVITSTLPLATRFNGRGPGFSMWEGHSGLFIDFQGIYTEQKNNGGERVLCLLGSTLLPSRQSGSDDPWKSVKGDRDILQPPLLQDDQILLTLHIPKSASLNRMAIQGEMRSLNSKSNQKYFDKVQIRSQLNAQIHHYEFSPSEVISKACDPYPYSDQSVNGGNELYKGLDFCETLKKVSTDASFSVAPHWRCNGTDEFCSKFGPFGFNKKINATDGSFKDARVLMQNIYCLADAKTHSNELSAKVFAVFRAFDSPDNLFVENQRSGFGNMTLVAEGTWKSSSGQLCMIGCLGTVDLEKRDCSSRICLYIPLSFSIKQRSLLIGSISSLEKNNPPFYPLSLEVLYQSLEYIYDSYTYKHPYYHYTKSVAAGAVLEKDEPFSFGTVIKRSLLTFPKLQDSEDYSESLRLLAEDLTLHVSALPDPLPSSQDFRTDVEMEILSLGPMFGRYWFSNDSIANLGSPYHTNASYTEKQLLLNVSTQFKLRGGPYSNFSVLFLEGLYDQHVGKMYLIGCRDVRASWRVLFDGKDFLDSGLDCSIEVIISYPPTTARWLLTPTASVSISSQRTEDDPLYFKPLKLLTLPVLYRQQREDILSRESFEGILKILTLSITIGCILRQLLYLRAITDYIPYMSLTMLGSQVIGFSLPLIIGAEALSKNANTENTNSPFYDLEKSQWTQVIDYIVKLQVLVCFILTLRLSQKVWRARARLLGQNGNRSCRAPSEKWVVLITLIIHILGYLLALIFHSVKTGQTPIGTQQYVDPTGNPQSLKTWETLLQEYTGLLQDLFLLPQVIANIIWQIDSKPLAKLYYMGITILRLLPHGYDYVRGPAATPFFSEEYEFVNRRFDFFSEFGDIAIPCLAIILAVIVYIQQRWNYEKLSNTLTIGHFRLLPMSSRMYEKIPFELAEAELVCDPTRRNVQKDDN